MPDRSTLPLPYRKSDPTANNPLAELVAGIARTFDLLPDPAQYGQGDRYLVAEDNGLYERVTVEGSAEWERIGTLAGSGALPPGYSSFYRLMMGENVPGTGTGEGPAVVPSWAPLPTLTYDEDTGTRVFQVGSFATNAESIVLVSPTGQGFTCSDDGEVTIPTDALAASTYALVLRAVNGSESADATLTVTVRPAPVAQPPVWATIPNQFATEGDGDWAFNAAQYVSVADGATLASIVLVTDNDGAEINGTIVSGSHATAQAENTHTLRATDSNGLTRDTTFSTRTAADAGSVVEYTLTPGDIPGSFDVNTPTLAQAPSTRARHRIEVKAFVAGYYYPWGTDPQTGDGHRLFIRNDGAIHGQDRIDGSQAPSNVYTIDAGWLAEGDFIDVDMNPDTGEVLISRDGVPAPGGSGVTAVEPTLDWTCNQVASDLLGSIRITAL